MVNQTLTRWEVIAAIEEPACEMADNADIALHYISGILADLDLEGHPCHRHKINAATRLLGCVARTAADLRDAAYRLMESPAPEILGAFEVVASETPPTAISEAVKRLSEELRIDWALSEYAEDAGSDENIELRQRDRVHTALESLEALVERANQ